MSKKQARHIRLDILARKLVATQLAKEWSPIPETTPLEHDAILEKLRKERLALTDFDFRKRYAAWL